MNRTFKIYVDFDGTVITEDMGEKLVNTLGDAVEIEKIIKRWINKDITSPESWILMLATIQEIEDKNIDELVSTVELDPEFLNFVGYCEKNGFEMRILSDGMDLYINKILKRENLLNIERYSNKAVIGADKKIVPAFPYGDEECKQCGNCKRNHIINSSSDEDFTVYIGDGYSDTCPAQYCDFIFAKRSLLKYCERERISYSPFNDFSDVIKKLDEYKGKKNLKKRHQAHLKRKALYIQG